jgi:hypothetical protein
MMEALCSSETSVVTIPEDGFLHSHRCENLKSYTVITYFGMFASHLSGVTEENKEHSRPGQDGSGTNS